MKNTKKDNMTAYPGRFVNLILSEPQMGQIGVVIYEI